MAGNFRSGPRARQKKVPTGAPRSPDDLTPDERWCWDNVIEPAKHLGSIDTALAWECCEIWGMYRQAVVAAKQDPIDKDNRIAFNTYATQFRDVVTKLGIDPLGRERMASKTERKSEESDPLAEFGVVG